MKKRYVMSILCVILCSCSAKGHLGSSFIEHFESLSEFPCGKNLKHMPLPTKDTISYNILAEKFLLPINSFEFAANYTPSTYCYLGKYEIDKGYYILACKVFYNFHDSRIILYTYNANQDIVTSSLLVGCHDNSLTIESEYKNGIIDIETTYKKVPNGLDPPEGREYIQKKYKKQYHINKNFCFAEYK